MIDAAGVDAGAWCPTCGVPSDAAQRVAALAVARARGGWVVEFHDDATATLQCANGHVWSALTGDLPTRWCALYSEPRTERGGSRRADVRVPRANL